MKTILKLIVTLLVLSDSANAGELVNIDRKGVALQGYDPVAYFTLHRPQKGDSKLSATYKGATYYFTSARHLELFQKTPEKYVPQFGGYCGYAASVKVVASVDPYYWQVIDGRLILQHNKEAWDLWIQDVAGNLRKADLNWPELSRKKPLFFN